MKKGCMIDFGFPDCFATLSELIQSPVHARAWDKLMRVVRSLQTPLEKLTVLPIAGAIVGAWLGAIPFALDWDRPWQVGPVVWF